MRAYDIILKKRQGLALTKEEIDFFISGLMDGSFADYQASALCMAIFFQGMDDRETTELTMAMANSGDVLNLSDIPGPVIDKHSTGGVADTTTLVLGPLVASCGIPVAKMSGRGLGHTGGTVDKLESIPGFSVDLTERQFKEQVQRIGISIIGQTSQLAPADKILYSLRDVTATVDSIPLIASSIMSKKIAAGAGGLVLDVKAGRGAFMKDLSEAERLAEMMVTIGQMAGRRTAALVSDMNQPLGSAIGNALEVKEAIQTLREVKNSRLTELCLQLGAEMLLLAGKAGSENDALEILSKKLSSGEALEKLRDLIIAQDGNPRVVDDLELLPQARYQEVIKAKSSGWIENVDALRLGVTAMSLGAGRTIKDSPIDLAVGIELLKHVGDRVEDGEPLAMLHANDASRLESARAEVLAALTVSQEQVSEPRLVIRKIR